ncbi:hypothetical protein [Mycobacterium sp. AZCC_0083]|uniref:hypothetical protein n=1 Tax=Mycobacterium sp. AZCC_0083 TaxID=2735882 RepID=UPI00180158FE|nr:hypothetical protein [Mycobacterium sp. AZCC_0083]MBB5164813.1 hypothetical protein [Mycobacterium sp. AZCC_0083]
MPGVLDRRRVTVLDQRRAHRGQCRREDRDRVLSQLLRWGVSMIAVAPLLAWAIFILPGW